jgi:hypothetical protein
MKAFKQRGERGCHLKASLKNPIDDINQVHCPYGVVENDD